MSGPAPCLYLSVSVMLRAGHARPLPRSFFKLPLQAFQMPLRQTVHFLGACKAKGADGLFLGGDDRHDGALGQRTALGGQGHDLSAVGSFSRAKRQQALFDHGRHGGVQRLLGDAPVRRNAVLGQRLARRHQRIQRPERCIRQAAPLRRRVVQGVALIELAVRFVQQGAGLGFLFFLSLSSLKSDFGFPV